MLTLCQVGAMRGIQQFCATLNEAEAAPYAGLIPGVFEGISAIAVSSPHEVVRVAIETLNSLVDLWPAAVVASEKTVLPLAIAVFLKTFNGAPFAVSLCAHTADHVMVELIVDLFSSFSRNAAMLPYVRHRLLPTAVSVIQQHANPVRVSLSV